MPDSCNDGGVLTHLNTGRSSSVNAENKNLKNKNTVLSFIKELNETVVGKTNSRAVLSKYLN